MKKTVFFAACAILAMLITCTAHAASYLVLRQAPLMQAPSDQAKVLAKADRGWLVHGKTEKGQNGTEAWLEVSEMQKASGDGFVYAHLAVKGAEGSVYVRADNAMPVPDQKEQVLPGEDSYTPSWDCDGTVYKSDKGKVLPFGENWLQEAGRHQFSKMLTGLDLPGMTGSEKVRLHIERAVQDAANPWQYQVTATYSGPGMSGTLSGTLTIKKAAMITGEFGTPYLAATGDKADSAMTEVHHGFAGADLELLSKDGSAGLHGTLISFFVLRFNPQAMSFDKDVYVNNIPEQLKDPNYRNFQFSGVFRKGSTEETCLFGRGMLANPHHSQSQKN